MKVVATLFIIYCIVIAHGLSDAVKGVIKKQKNACITESGVDEAIVNNAAEGDYVEDPKLKSFGLCFMKKTGLMNDQGEILKNKVLEKMNMLVGKEVAGEIVQKCGDKHGSTPEETAMEFGKCFQPYKPKDL